MNERHARYVLHVPASGTQVPVYEGEDEDEALNRAIATDPALRARAERVAQRRAAREPGIPAEEVFRSLAKEQMQTKVPARPTRTSQRPRGQFTGRFLVRVPASVHRQLAERANAEGTTLNQLVLNYLNRGLGLESVEAR